LADAIFWWSGFHYFLRKVLPGFQKIFCFESLNLKGRDHLEYLGVDGRIILGRILRKTGWEVMDWIYLAQDSV
jgi:hypothetical protein